MGHGNRLGRALSQEKRSPEDKENDGNGNTRRRVKSSAQDRCNHGANNVDELVNRGLQGEGAIELGDGVSRANPTCTNQCAWRTPRGSRDTCRHEEDPCGGDF